MKITIDTQTDTHDEIKKVLHILTGMIERKEPLQSSPPTDTTNMMNMFSDSSESPVVEEKTETAPDFGALLNLGRKEDEEKEEPKVQFF